MKIGQERKTVKFVLKSSIEPAQLPGELKTELKNIEIVLSCEGAFVQDRSNQKRVGPYPHVDAISSLEVGEELGIIPKQFFAFKIGLCHGPSHINCSTCNRNRPKEVVPIWG